MEEKKLITTYLQEQWSIEMNDQFSMDEIKEKLSHHINYLVNNDFARLINMLYTVDVNESRLKYLLKENASLDAGHIIAGLIIERQVQKIKTREDIKSAYDQSDEEKW
jgi:hypothetical protein